MHIHMDVSMHVYFGKGVATAEREIFVSAAISGENTN